MLIQRKFVCAAVVATCMTVAGSVANAAEKSFTVSAGSIGGSWFVYMTTLFETYKNNIADLNYNTVPGGGVANPIAVSTGKAQFALAYSPNLVAAYKGDEPYKNKLEDIRVVANMNMTAVIHPFFSKDLGISSMREIAEKKIPLKIDTGPKGGGGELAASRILEAHGASYDNIRAWGGQITHSPYREAVDRVRDGHIDAFMNDDNIGAPLFAEFASDDDIVILPQDQDAIEKLTSIYGYSAAVIPAGTYSGQTKDLPTTSQSVVFFTTKDMPEDLVYQMTKLFFEKKQDLTAGHANFAKLDPMAGPKVPVVPLHPGAERYYREIGAL